MSDLYRVDRPWLTIQREALDSAATLDLLKAGAVDLAFVSWLPHDLDPGMWRSPFAFDAIAVIVHPANPVSGLSLAQLREIFQGRVLDWSPFAWEGGKVIVVSREDGSGTRAAFEDAVMEGHAVTLNAIVQPDSDAMIDYVARTPGAIGYVSRARATNDVKPIALEGVAPIPADNAYPVSRVLYVVARQEPTGAAREFVAWLLSGEGQQAVGERGFGRVS